MSCSRQTRTAINETVPAATALRTNGSFREANPTTSNTVPMAPNTTDVTSAGGRGADMAPSCQTEPAMGGTGCGPRAPLGPGQFIDGSGG